MSQVNCIKRILFLQKAEVLEQQRNQVLMTISRALPGVEVVCAGSPDDVVAGSQIDVIISPTLPWLPDILTKIEGLRWIHFLSAGVEKVWDMPFEKRYILMSKSSGVHGAPMSEYAIGAMLFFAKQFNRFVAQSRCHSWQRAWLSEFAGSRLVILGLGHIGQSLAQRAKVFGMEVSGTLRTPRYLPDVDNVVTLSEIGGLLSQADYLAVCLPLTDETRGLVNSEFLNKLKPGAVLVDISRGGVVRGDDIIQSLENGQLRGAALDVFEQQPLPPDSPLWSRDDVLLTPHVSGTTPHYLQRALDIFVQNAMAYLAGEPLVTAVDVQAGY